MCIRLDKDAIIKRTAARKKSGHGHPKKNIFRAYDYLLCKHIREITIAFLVKHDQTLSDIVFQCYSDCRDFIKINALRHDNVGDAYMLADMVAWPNNKDKEPLGVKSLDLRVMIDAELKKRFK